MFNTTSDLFAILLARATGGGGGGGGGFNPTNRQLAAMNSGITSTDVAQIQTNKNNISAIQQTIGDINSVLEEVL